MLSVGSLSYKLWLVCVCVPVRVSVNMWERKRKRVCRVNCWAATCVWPMRRMSNERWGGTRRNQVFVCATKARRSLSRERERGKEGDGNCSSISFICFANLVLPICVAHFFGLAKDFTAACNGHAVRWHIIDIIKNRQMNSRRRILSAVLPYSHVTL